MTKNKENKTYECRHCNKVISYKDADKEWSYELSGYDTKVIRCKECGEILGFEYVEASWMRDGF